MLKEVNYDGTLTSPRADYHHSVREDLEMQDNYILPKQYPE